MKIAGCLFAGVITCSCMAETTLFVEDFEKLASGQPYEKIRHQWGAREGVIQKITDKNAAEGKKSLEFEIGVAKMHGYVLHLPDAPDEKSKILEYQFMFTGNGRFSWELNSNIKQKLFSWGINKGVFFTRSPNEGKAVILAPVQTDTWYTVRLEIPPSHSAEKVKLILTNTRTMTSMTKKLCDTIKSKKLSFRLIVGGNSNENHRIFIDAIRYLYAD